MKHPTSPRTPSPSSARRAPLPSLALLLGAALFACTGETEDEGGDDVGDDEVSLGSTPLANCEAAMFTYEQIVAELALPNPDPEYIIDLYRGDAPDFSDESPVLGGTALQRWVREVDARLGRVETGLLVDDAAIEAALDLAVASEDSLERRMALLEIIGTMRLVASLDTRERLASLSEVLPDPDRDPAVLRADWDQAYCVWTGVLGPLSTQATADEGAVEPTGVDWDAQILEAFEDGYAGLEGPEEAWAPDDWVTKAAKQKVEKSTFAVIDRRIVALAQDALDGGDEAAAHEALGLFDILEDRINERNTPAVEGIREMLAGDTAAIDPAWIEEQMAIAFVKRARKYCDEALDEGSIGTPDGYKGAWEGTIYSQVVLPLMIEYVDGFDAETYLQAWADYRAAMIADDSEAALEISPQLIEANCALQDALGIAECTADQDESA
ncbi:hypothetical protein G6O69_09955 [Pseudenhygromyxa sp. WMMC2535]|uniref:hypothetical protein n=1 Tax=Pseudenhygromyxa sp. WMMC2535 TaxID=2712867 RepID=UPI00155752BF|nr:hypothetical protein [Pseudenhygromyxa sp. WMMC2535]NVB38156.1 hypothetical protein [Pseudenhygromyxa sp. WMMC2535]